jgi:hypothetical protein
MRRSNARMNFRAIGVTVLAGAVVQLTRGQRQSAFMGFILAAAILVWNEWYWWRRNQDR